MKTHLSRSGGSRHGRGFSLVELLVVIAIISILMSVAAIGIGGMTGGKSVTTALASTEAFFEEARTHAISSHVPTRVLVDVSDPADRENYLRRMITVYQKTDEDGKALPDQWLLLNRGLVLPDQVFFSRNFSKTSIEENAESAELPELELEESADIRPAYAGKYLYYEFNPEGLCSTPGASFIIGTGVRPGTAERPMVTAAAKRDFGGFVIWRNGRTSLIRSPQQMNLPDNVKNF
ncbi:MAG: prepilin-type N-terminal cleavage/methylation domain-containing protein [Luteolibacter sp.]